MGPRGIFMILASMVLLHADLSPFSGVASASEHDAPHWQGGSKSPTSVSDSKRLAHLLHAWRGSSVHTDKLVQHFELASRNLTTWQRELFGRAEKVNAKLMKATNGGPVDWGTRAQLFDIADVTSTCPPGTSLSYVGAAIGQDGGKWVCGVDKLQSPCVVFSLGSNGNYQFEESVLAKTPCTVHTFDCTVSGGNIKKLNDRHFFYKICIGSAEKAAADPIFKSLPQAMHLAGVTWVDVLKIDIEGYEFDVLATWGTKEESKLDRTYLPAQVLIEVHVAGVYFGTSFFNSQDLSNLLWPANPHGITMPELALFFGHLAELGYAVVNQEKNTLCSHCSEFTLLKVR